MLEQTHNSSQKRDEQLPEAALPPASGQMPAAPPNPSDWGLSPLDINRLISAQDSWQETLSELSGAIACHPETTLMLREASSTSETNVPNLVVGQGKSNEAQCERRLGEARTHLHP